MYKASQVNWDKAHILIRLGSCCEFSDDFLAEALNERPFLDELTSGAVKWVVMTIEGTLLLLQLRKPAGTDVILRKYMYRRILL